jgi:hypothetical protein
LVLAKAPTAYLAKSSMLNCAMTRHTPSHRRPQKRQRTICISIRSMGSW